MLNVIHILYLIISPFLLPFSPIALLMSYLQLIEDCNTATYANVLQVNHIDMFRCEAQLYIPEYNHYAPVSIECHEITHEITHGITHEIIQNNLTNITIIMNKLYKEKACLQIVKSNKDLLFTDYDSTIIFYYISLVEVILLLLFILVLCIQQQ